MGWGSYQEDNLDARGESIKTSRLSIVLPKKKAVKPKKRAVKSEDSIYEYKNKPLTRSVVEKIFMQWYINTQ